MASLKMLEKQYVQADFCGCKAIQTIGRQMRSQRAAVTYGESE